METQLGKNIIRKEARDKVTGMAKYTNDLSDSPMLEAKVLTSPHAHAEIIKLDTTAASNMPGVKAILTAENNPLYKGNLNPEVLLCGSVLRDRPWIAYKRVRYFGEPVAVIIADTGQQARAAALAIVAEYKPLPVVNSVKDALSSKTLLHPDLMTYKTMIDEVYPQPKTNICHHQKIRKNAWQGGFKGCDVIAEGKFELPQSDHAAMETRVARAKIMPDGNVIIKASSQAPYGIKELIAKYFGIPEGKIVVEVPFIGGGFGGKASVHLEIIAVMCSLAMGGKCVNISNSREEDLASSPCHLGLEGSVKLGASKDGKLISAEMTFYVDSGAYSDISPKMAKALAAECTGVYYIPNVKCDSYSVYTNHTYVTSYRGFGHEEVTFCIERTMDKLAVALKMDTLELRLLNASREGDTKPTGVVVTLNNTGDAVLCLKKLRDLMKWDEGSYRQNGNFITAKGLSCFIKTSDSPTDAGSGAVITFNSDGSINLNVGAVEMGPGMKTTAAQILAERMKMDIDDIHIFLGVNTQTTPILWKTVASMTTLMLGKAVLSAAEDAIKQLTDAASAALKCPPEDLDIENKKVFLKSDPTVHIGFTDLVNGYKYESGNTVKGPVIGRGSFVMNHLTPLDPETGTGRNGQSWTVGAQGIEVEYDKRRHTYRILKAATVIDAGKVLNPKTAKGLVMGGMCMGLGLATCEEFVYDKNAVLSNTSFRTYKMLRYGETPEYLVEFVETPQIDAPFGARGLGEHGILGIPAAVANALYLASGVDITSIPITPEYLWRHKR